MAISKEEAVRLTLLERGELPQAELIDYVKHRFGLTIEAKFLPFYMASLRDREQLAALRGARRTALAAAESASTQ